MYKVAEQAAHTHFEPCERRVCLMTTFEVLMVLINLGLLIIAYLEWKSKKQPPDLTG